MSSAIRCSSYVKIIRSHIYICILFYLVSHVQCVMTGTGEDRTNGHSSLNIPQFIQNHQQVSGNFPARNSSYIQSLGEQTSETRELQEDISKRNARSFYYPGGGGGYGNDGEPFCYDRYVKGNCRYRTDPSECFSYEWTAYSTIQLRGGISNLYSIPDGLYLPELQGNIRERVRVFLKVSCCTPVVQFISTGAWRTQENVCVVDVRELQGLHPGEIAGIVIAAVLLLIIIIVIIVVIVKRRRRDRMPVLVGRAHLAPASSRDREVTRQ